MIIMGQKEIWFIPPSIPHNGKTTVHRKPRREDIYNGKTTVHRKPRREDIWSRQELS